MTFLGQETSESSVMPAFTIQNKPGSLDDVIVGRRATCRGTFNDQTQFVATRVDVWTK